MVSATRTEQPLLSAPSNISVINSQQLLITQAEHIQQQLSQVPGVSLQRGDGQESLPGIRSAVLTGAGACGNVLIMEDGLPVRGPAFCNVNELFDTHYEQASQIEVTRGPGTSFYGSNALTGSINVQLPVNPTDSISVEIGEHDYRRIKGVFSYGQSAIDSAQGALYLTSTDTDSFREDSGYQQHKLSWRHQQMLANWQVKAGLTATRLDQQTAGFIEGLDSFRDSTLAAQNLDPQAFRKSDALRAWASFSRTIASGHQLQITPYLRATDMDFRLHFLPGDPLEQNRQFGAGWQSSLRGEINDNVNWAIGFDADFTDSDLIQSQDEPTPGSAFLQATVPVGVQYDYTVDAQQFGLFAHLDWRVNDRLSVLAGARAERLNYDYDNNSLDGRTRDDGTECGFGGCRYSRPADRKDSFSDLSPKLELRYQLNEYVRVYGSLASSFRAPQAAELYRLQREQQVAELESVNARNAEIGVSYQRHDLQLSASIYSLSQTNVIIRDSDFFNLDGNKVDSQGVEVSLDYLASDQWRWALSGTWSEHEYASDQISGGININGNEVDTAPSSQINAALTWQPRSDLSMQLQVQHVGAYFLEPENLREYPGHEVVNLRLTHQFSPRLQLSARLLNVADQAYAERADFTAFTQERYFPGMPRTAFVGLRYQFGESTL